MTPLIAAALFSVFVFSMIYAAYDYLGGGNYEDRKIKSRVEALFLRKTAESIERKSAFSNILGLNKALKRQPLSKKLFTLLALTGWNMPISVFMLADCIWGGMVFMLASVIFRNLMTATAITLLALLLPYWFLVVNKRRYIAKFTTAFPDALMMIKSAIRSGQGIQAAFQMVAKEGPQPVAREFAQVVHEIELGNQLTEALQELYRRIETIDLRIFVLGIFIQTEVGGNLVELLNHIEVTIRERLAMMREVKTLSAQGKMTGVVLMLLPLGLSLVLLMINREYFNPLLTSETGRKILGFAIGMQVVGAFIVRKITSFRVT